MKNSTTVKSSSQEKIACIRTLWNHLTILRRGPKKVEARQLTRGKRDLSIWQYCESTPSNYSRNKLLIITPSSEDENIAESKNISDAAAQLGFHCLRIDIAADELWDDEIGGWNRRIYDILHQLERSSPNSGWGVFCTAESSFGRDIIAAETMHARSAKSHFNKIQFQLSAA